MGVRVPLLITSVVEVTPAQPSRFRPWIVRAAIALSLVALSNSEEVDVALGENDNSVLEVDAGAVSGVVSSGDHDGESFLESLLASLDSFPALVLVQETLPSSTSRGLFLGMVLLLLIYSISRRCGKGMARGSRSGVLLLGPCGSGKTAMVHRLCHNRLVSTVTSMQAGRFEYRADPSTGASPFSPLVDYPGHERLRGGVAEELTRVERVVFVLDCSNLTAQVAAAAELLYDVLTDSTIESCEGILLACNKNDLRTVKLSRVKTLLERELDNLRGTSGTLETQGGEEQHLGAMSLGRPGQPFSLDIDSPCEVSMIACSVKDDNLGAVRDFIAATMR
ncbi:unnamed protein product [Choristocarpus tenellus]